MRAQPTSLSSSRGQRKLRRQLVRYDRCPYILSTATIPSVPHHDTAECTART